MNEVRASVWKLRLLREASRYPGRSLMARRTEFVGVTEGALGLKIPADWHDVLSEGDADLGEGGGESGPLDFDLRPM